jgi:hypothetical protein
MLIATKQGKKYHANRNKFITNIPQIANIRMIKWGDKSNYL